MRFNSGDRGTDLQQADGPNGRADGGHDADVIPFSFFKMDALWNKGKLGVTAFEGGESPKPGALFGFNPAVLVRLPLWAFIITQVLPLRRRYDRDMLFLHSFGATQ